MTISPTRPVAEKEDDGTRPLLKVGGSSLAVGIVFAVITARSFGVRPGEVWPQTNVGWLALVAAALFLPMGALLFALGAAKWLRRRSK